MSSPFQKLEESRLFLSGLYYVYLRFFEIEAAWLLRSHDIDFKVKIGKKLGYDRDCLIRISQRLQEMFCLTAVPLQPAGIEDIFTHVIETSQENEMETWIFRFRTFLESQIEKQLAVVDIEADEPTHRLLDHLLNIGPKNFSQFEHQFPDTDGAVHWPQLSISTDIEYTGNEPLPTWFSEPQRPSHFSFSSSSYLSMKSLEDLLSIEEELEKFIHFVSLDIEICAMEVCASNILENRSMPLEFKTDMAHQIWDEARHAKLLSTYLNAMGKQIGDYPYTASVWFRHQLGTTLSERLAIQQVLQEGDSVDNNVNLIEFFSKHDYKELAHILEYINADETMHARMGNKWLYYLAGESDESYMETLEAAARKIDSKIPGSLAFNPIARSIAGFPQWFIERYKS